MRRIVSLAPSSTEILYALGVGDRIVGVDQYSDWPPAAARVPRVGSDLSPERRAHRRAQARRRLHRHQRQRARAARSSSSALGVHVVISHIATLDDLWRDIGATGDAVGRHDAARRARRRGCARASPRPTRASPRCRRRGRWWSSGPIRSPSSAATRFVDDVIRAAGGDNIAGDSPQPYPQYSVERMLARAPEVIVVGSHAGGPTLAPLTAHASLPAVKNGRVHSVDGNLLFRPGPRLVDGVELLARLFHP